MAVGAIPLRRSVGAVVPAAAGLEEEKTGPGQMLSYTNIFISHQYRLLHAHQYVDLCPRIRS